MIDFFKENPFEFLLFLLICFLFLLIPLDVYKDFKISQEIIKKSEDYTIFYKCHKIQNKYYCKWVD